MKIFAEDVSTILKCLFICSDGILKIKNSFYNRSGCHLGKLSFSVNLYNAKFMYKSHRIE